jgi:hypothetical protein
MSVLSFAKSVQETAVGATTDFFEWSIPKIKNAQEIAVGVATDTIESVAAGLNAVDSSSKSNKEATETVDSDKKSDQGKLSKDPNQIDFFRYPIEVQALGDKIKHWIEIDISEIQSETLTKEKLQGVLTDAMETASNVLTPAARTVSEEVQTAETAGGIPGAIAAGVVGTFRESWRSTAQLAQKFGAGAAETLKGTITTVKKESPRNKLKAKLAIYMPDTIFFNQRNDYTERKFDEIFGLIGQTAQIGSSIAGDISQALSSNGPGMVNSILRGPGAGGRELAGAVAPLFGADKDAFAAGLLKSAGFALNPQVELFFTGVDRRTFQFDFRFNSRSAKETEQIQGIIKTLRKHAAPTLAAEGSGRYFIPPSIFDINFCFYEPEKGWKINDKLPKINRCVLESIDVNYNGSGKYITYEDGQPIDIELRLMFKETDIMTRAEIEAGY